MNKVAQWVDALRSGKYKQTRGYLHEIGVGHCCFGVLCDLSPLEGETYGSRRLREAFGGSATEVPGSVIEWLDAYLPGGYVDQLYHMNDGELKKEDGTDYNFNDIADWIEANIYGFDNLPPIA